MAYGLCRNNAFSLIFYLKADQTITWAFYGNVYSKLFSYTIDFGQTNVENKTHKVMNRIKKFSNLSKFE